MKLREELSEPGSAQICSVVAEYRCVDREPSGDDVATWNDAPGRTAAEVAAALRAAAELAGGEA